MSKTHRGWVSGVALLGLTAAGLAPLTLGDAGSAAAAQVGLASPSLFGDAPATTARMVADRSLGSFKRSRFVSFRASALPTAARGQQVDLPFFDDATFRGEVDHLDRQPLLTTWSGPIDGTDGGTFVVTESQGRYQVTASTTDGSFTMNQTATGAFQVEQVIQPHAVDAGDLPRAERKKDADPVSVPAGYRMSATDAVLAPAAELQRQTAQKKGHKQARGDDGSVEDVLVVYSAATAAAYGGVTGVTAEAAKNIGYTNAAYANSGVKTTARLVGVVPTKTAGRRGNGIGRDLNNLIRRGDGRFDDVFKYIRKTHADDTILLAPPPPQDAQVCGIAALKKNQPAAQAFGVVSTGTCTDGYYSFPHELGHNQGAEHDLWTLKHSSVGKGPLDAQYRYGYGYVDPGFNFYSIMAYYEECYYVGGVQCPQLMSFSNPTVYVFGLPTGTTKRNDVAKLISKTRHRVASHQQSTLYLRQKLAIKPAPKAKRGAVHASFSGWINKGRVKTKFAWYLDGARIKGAKGRTYRPRKKDRGHQLSVQVTGKAHTYAKVVLSSGTRTVK